MGTPLHVRVDEEGRAWLGQNTAGLYSVVQDDAGNITMTRSPEPRSSRVVDRFGYGWLRQGDTETYRVYPKVDGCPSTMPHDQLAAERGPLRDVVPASDADRREIAFLLAATKDKALSTLLGALAWLGEACVEADGHYYRMVAGRPGSWEAALLIELAQQAPKTPADKLDRPEAEVGRILWTWLFEEFALESRGDPKVAELVPQPRGVSEVADTLAGVFGRVVDGRGGWDEVVDDDLNWDLACKAQRLLYSQSRHFDAAELG